VLVNKILANGMKVTLKVPARTKRVDTYQVAESLGLRVHTESAKTRPVVVDLPPLAVMLAATRRDGAVRLEQ
jgi:hypothetical protein